MQGDEQNAEGIESLRDSILGNARSIAVVGCAMGTAVAACRPMIVAKSDDQSPISQLEHLNLRATRVSDTGIAHLTQRQRSAGFIVYASDWD